MISPGGVGYDINCGVRLMRTNLILRRRSSRGCGPLMEALFRRIPAGVGRAGRTVRRQGTARLLAEGPRYLADRGLATPSDIEHTEAGGCLAGAEPDAVSQRAQQRGGDQCGTLGSGNHFLEVQVVDEIFDEAAAGVWAWKKARSA